MIESTVRCYLSNVKSRRDWLDGPSVEVERHHQAANRCRPPVELTGRELRQRCERTYYRALDCGRRPRILVAGLHREHLTRHVHGQRDHRAHTLRERRWVHGFDPRRAPGFIDVELE